MYGFSSSTKTKLIKLTGTILFWQALRSSALATQPNCIAPLIRRSRLQFWIEMGWS